MPSLARLLFSTGWHSAAAGTVRMWEDCYSAGFVPGVGL